MLKTLLLCGEGTRQQRLHLSVCHGLGNVCIICLSVCLSWIRECVYHLALVYTIPYGLTIPPPP